MHEDVLGLLKGIAWPLLVLAALILFRKQLSEFIGKLTEVLGKAGKISIGSKGLDITIDEKLAAVNTRVTALQATQEIAKQEFFGTSVREGGSGQIPDRLRALAAQYREADKIDSRKDRIRRKNDIAAEMGAVATSERVRPEALIEANDEVLLAAFASMVIVAPAPGDLGLLLKASCQVERLHVRYRLVLAIAVLINKGFVGAKDKQSVVKALEILSREADPRWRS